jgi:hypothetical protein
MGFFGFGCFLACVLLCRFAFGRFVSAVVAFSLCCCVFGFAALWRVRFFPFAFNRCAFFVLVRFSAGFPPAALVLFSFSVSLFAFAPFSFHAPARVSQLSIMFALLSIPLRFIGFC